MEEIEIDLVNIKGLITTILKKNDLKNMSSMGELHQMINSLNMKLELMISDSKEKPNLHEQVILSEILAPVTLPEELSLKYYSKNNIKLLNYYKIGLFIENILTNINDNIINDGYGLHHNSIVTGIIKGSGIANFFFNQRGNNHCNVARKVYNKSRRVYFVYKCFGYPKAFAQIYGASTITGNKLLTYGNEKNFEKLVKKIENVVNNNYDKYDYQSNSLLQFGEKFNIIPVSIEITNNVLKFIKEPSASINFNNTCNKILKDALDIVNNL